MKSYLTLVLILALTFSCKSHTKTQSAAKASSGYTLEQADQKMKAYVDDGLMTWVSG